MNSWFLIVQFLSNERDNRVSTLSARRWFVSTVPHSKNRGVQREMANSSQVWTGKKGLEYHVQYQNKGVEFKFSKQEWNGLLLVKYRTG